MDNQKSDIKEGSIFFLIDKAKIQYNGNTKIPLFFSNLEGGNISMIKDEDNKLKLLHNRQDLGTAEVTVDVSKLDPNRKHVFAATWSFAKKEIIMYIDGIQVGKQELHIKIE